MRVMTGTRWGASKKVLLGVLNVRRTDTIGHRLWMNRLFASDTASATTKARLDVIQAKAPRICCGAMVGTPTSAVQVECGQPPLALRRPRMAADYAVKIKSTPEHPTASTLDDCWSNHYGNYSAGREPFGVKVTRVLKEAGVNVRASLHGYSRQDLITPYTSNRCEIRSETMSLNNGKKAGITVILDSSTASFIQQ